MRKLVSAYVKVVRLVWSELAYGLLVSLLHMFSLLFLLFENERHAMDYNACICMDLRSWMLCICGIVLAWLRLCLCVLNLMEIHACLNVCLQFMLNHDVFEMFMDFLVLLLNVLTMYVLYWFADGDYVAMWALYVWLVMSWILWLYDGWWVFES